jgi:hypothetical protein
MAYGCIMKINFLGCTWWWWSFFLTDSGCNYGCILTIIFVVFFNVTLFIFSWEVKWFILRAKDDKMPPSVEKRILHSYKYKAEVG